MYKNIWKHNKSFTKQNTTFVKQLLKNKTKLKIYKK